MKRIVFFFLVYCLLCALVGLLMSCAEMPPINKQVVTEKIEIKKVTIFELYY